MDKDTRNLIQRATLDARRLLEREYREQLEGTFDIMADSGAIAAQPGAHLDARQQFSRSKIVMAIRHERAKCGGDAEAVQAYLREAAFTMLNRFAALKMMEARKIVLECVSKGELSAGFREFTGLAPGLATLPDHGYRLYLECLFDEIGTELGVLFDRRDSASLLWPRRQALTDLLDILNRPELAAANIWVEDETIGWIYQYFNDEAERKKMREESAAPRNSRELAVRNQFFTPRYVVQFLTDNTLGRIWYEMTKGRTRLKDQCRYLVRRPNEVFLGNPAVLSCLASAAPWVREVIETASFAKLPESPTIAALADFGLAIDGYAEMARRGRSWDDFVAQFVDHQSETAERDGTPWKGDAFELWCALFAYQRSALREGDYKDEDTFADDAFLRSLWPALRQALMTPPQNLSQEELLRQPVFIPHRPIKDPREILMLDPACGSMHFGLYAFDLFEGIYEEARAGHVDFGTGGLREQPDGFALERDFPDPEAFRREVPRLIIEHNIHGIDIDPRAAQIAGLALWLRAQKAWQRLGLKPAERPAIRRSNIVCAEPMPGEKELLREFVEREFPAAERGVFLRLLEVVFDKMQLAGEAGSLLKIEEEIRDAIAETKRLWQAGPKLEQPTLFGEDVPTPQQKEMKLDLSGITDEQFWERAEEQVYEKLRDYAEWAEGGGGFQRRLFAEDAARGFAFIDVCRKRYDVALMNPPFGSAVSRTIEILESPLTSGRADIYSSFMARAATLTQSGGRVGALTSRTFLVLSSFSDLRRHLVGNYRSFSLCADLGMGVLDGAGVYAAASVFWGHPSDPVRHIEFFDCRDAEDKETELHTAICRSGLGRHSVLPADAFDRIPDYAMPYWAGKPMFDCYRLLPAFEPDTGLVRQGLSTGDDDRFLRLWWEAEPSAVGIDKFFCCFEKGGDFCPFYHDSSLLLRWSSCGQEVKAFTEATYGSAGRVIHSTEHYFDAGLTYSRLTVKGFHVRVLPAGSIFSSAGMFIGTRTQEERWVVLGYLNSRVVRSLLGMITDGRKWEIGYVRKIPTPRFSQKLSKEVATHAASLYRSVREICRNYETDRSFSGVVVEPNRAEMERLEESLNHICDEAIGLASDQEHLGDSLIGLWLADLETGREATLKDRSSYLLGVAFGRWDIRYATGEQAPPELPDPFAPLPVCPPGQLQNAQGLPARPEDVPAAYPVRIPWDGILVDDPNHPLDIERRVREVIEIIWGAKERSTPHPGPLPGRGGEGGATAEAIEHEACEILGVKTLRDYFRKSFFADHLKRYSKSRRQAPIYWPLSTASGSYTVWLYYHRFAKDTLYRVQELANDKLAFEERQLTNLRQESGPNPSAGQRKQLAEKEAFVQELREFRTEIARVAPLWNPDLNDGVIINFAPLWRLIAHRPWQKAVKECWDALVAGDYDWAHLALHLWPERVVPKCQTDRSLAIAHSLDAVFWEEDDKGKWHAKKVLKAELDRLIAERTSPAVKDALKSLVEAPVAGGGKKRKRE
jgi:hypothetical protein